MNLILFDLTSSLYQLTHPSMFFCWSGVSLWWQQVKWVNQTFLCPWAFPALPEGPPDVPRPDEICRCDRANSGSSTSETWLWRDRPRRHPKPSHLVPFHPEESYCESIVTSSHPFHLQAWAQPPVAECKISRLLFTISPTCYGITSNVGCSVLTKTTRVWNRQWTCCAHWATGHGGGRSFWL